MLLERSTDGESKPLLGFQAGPMFAVDGADLAEITGQVACGHATEPLHPGFEAAVIRIDVLYVPSAIDADTGRQIDGMMFDAQVTRRAGRRFAAIGAEHDIFRDVRL